MSSRKPRYLNTLIVMVCVCFFLCAPGAVAQCIPGMPCVNGLTPNDPYEPPIDPNTSGPNAPKIENGDMCDADFMNQIYSRAWLEAERENIMAELIIAKPDSTLEYSCYEQITSMTAEVADPRFTDTDFWWNKRVRIDGKLGFQYIPNVLIHTHMCNGNFPCDKLDIALEDIVLEALKEYVDTDFVHDYLGGHATGLNNDITGSISGYYLCDFINSVHFMAKCTDFAVLDQFFTFERLVQLDPRIFPQQCPTGTAITQDYIDVAYNEGDQYSFKNPLDNTYLDETTPGQCANSQAIPTGVHIRRKITTFGGGGGAFHRFEDYDEYVCTKPGCTYLPTQGCR